MLFMKPFDPGTFTAPDDTVKTMVGTVFGYAGWIVAVIACFALLGCAVLAWSRHRSGQSNEGVEKAGWVVGGVMAVGMIVGFVGTISGT
jgi:hypothetical protein